MNKHTLRWLAAGVIALAVIGGLIAILRAQSQRAEPALTVVTYGGALRAAQIAVLDRALRQAVGGPVLWAEGLGEVAPVAAQVRAGNVLFDVIALNTSAVVLGCERGWFELLSDSDLPEGLSTDVISGARVDCGIGAHVWAQVVGYRCDSGSRPVTLADFFDVGRFPGRRGLPRTPDGVLEWALLADNVPPERIYSELQTEAGLTRAFAKLDTIRSNVIWWESGAQALQLLMDGEVVMTAIPAARVALAVAREKAPLCLLWDGQFRRVDAWAIVRGSRHQAAARKFIALATQLENQAALSLRYPNAPVRRSANALLGPTSALGIDVRPWLPTSVGNERRLLTLDAEFWADRQEELYLRFTSWLDQGSKP